MGLDKSLHGQKLARFHLAFTRDWQNWTNFERLSLQVWDLKKPGRLFDWHSSIFCTDLCKHPNRATFCSDSAVMAWNQMP